MQQLWFWKGTSNPVQETPRRLKSFLAVCCMVMAALVLAPAPVKAQSYFSGLQTIRDALEGNSAALAILENDLSGGNIGTTEFLEQITNAYGGNTVAALAALENALSGSISELRDLQNALGGPLFGGGNDTANNILNLALAGNGAAGIQTMLLLVQNQPGAQAVIDFLTNGGANLTRNTLIAELGGGDIADALATLQGALNGEVAALDLLRGVGDLLSGSGIPQLAQDWFTNNILPALGFDPGDLDPDLPDPDLPEDPDNPDDPDNPEEPPEEEADNEPSIFSGGNPLPGPIVPCMPVGAVYTGTFGGNPCLWTRLNLLTNPLWGLNYYNYTFTLRPGGWQVIRYLSEWWFEQMRPAMQDQAAQLHAGKIDETRQLGTMFEAHALGKTGLQLQESEYKLKMDFMPNEKTCAATSHIAPLAHGNAIIAPLARGLKTEFKKETATAPPEGAAGAPPAPGAPPPPASPLEDIAQRFDDYCRYFRGVIQFEGSAEPETTITSDGVVNDGADPCAGQDWAAEDSVREFMTDANSTSNGDYEDIDIDIENFLLGDRINFSDPIHRKASVAMLRNLVQPVKDEAPPPGAENTDAGRTWLIIQEHKKSARTIATDVLASMMSRRMAMPATSFLHAPTGPHNIDPPIVENPNVEPLNPPPPTTPDGTAPAGHLGGARGDYTALLARIAMRESSNRLDADNSIPRGSSSVNGHPSKGFIGLYQMGRPALQDVGCIRTGGAYGNWRNGNNWALGGWTLNCPSSAVAVSTFPEGRGQAVTSKNDFRGIARPGWTDKALVRSIQNAAAEAYFYRQWAYMSEFRGRICQTVAIPKSGGFEMMTLTASGMLGAAHLVGSGKAIEYLRRNLGQGGNPPANPTRAVAQDANGTRMTEYMQLFNNYLFAPHNFDPPGASMEAGACPNGHAPTSLGYDTEAAASAPASPDHTIALMRQRAGILAKYISDGEGVSYNEIMNVMTKERFFDPAYYAQIADNEGAVRQEQTIVNAYTALQLQDIYKLQEQINALLAVRAALKMNADRLPAASVSRVPHN